MHACINNVLTCAYVSNVSFAKTNALRWCTTEAISLVSAVGEKENRSGVGFRRRRYARVSLFALQQ